MAGAFDFFVDESLLEQLLGGGDSTKNKKDGNVKLSPSPAPVVALAPAGTPVASPAAFEAQASPQIDDEAPAAFDEVVEEAPAQESLATDAWRQADRLYAAGDLVAAAQAYEQAAVIASTDAALVSTLCYNAALCWLQAGQLDPALQSLKNSLEGSAESRSVRLALALTCFRLNQHADAVEHCNRVLAANPADEDALLGKLQALCGAQNFEEATQVCTAFRDLHPRSAIGFEATLAVCAARKDRAGVEQAARDLREVNPESTIALKVLAAVAIAERDFETAASHCDALIASPDADFESCLHAAETFQQCGRLGQAAEAAARASQIDPQSHEALLKLAECQQTLEQWEDAKTTYRRAVTLNPNCPDALWNLALVFEQLGSFDQATESLTVAVRIRPEWEEASIRLASLQAAGGRLHEASAVLEHCLMLRKDWPEALFLTGIVLHQMGQSGPAQDAVLKALEFKPDETSWIESLERIAVDRDDALVALDCHEKLAESNIETPEMAYNLGVVLQKENEPELAAKCYVRALEQKPDFDLALLNLGYALRDLGREDEARACWGKAVRLDPSMATGYFQ